MLVKIKIVLALDNVFVKYYIGEVPFC